MKLRLGLLVVLLAALPAVPAFAADEFPQRPLRIIVPFPAGAGPDNVARLVGQHLQDAFGQTVLIENRAGALGSIGAQEVARSAPDGYTLLMGTNTTHASNVATLKSLPYDPVKDFAPVTLLGKGGQVMIVNMKVPATTVKEFIALAKKDPGKYSFGSGSSSSRIAGELFQQMAGVQLLHVPYKSNPLAVTDLLGGQIDMMITDNATGLPQVKGGKVRALGMSSLKRSPLAPDVPTIDEAGVKGYEMSYWFAAYVPAKTPPAVVAKLHDLLVAAVKGAPARQFYESTGTEAVTSTPQDLAKFQAEESKKWGRIIKAANIQAE
jgi:tripartite-type tricarboxylate transporter receptor subunit TctC